MSTPPTDFERIVERIARGTYVSLTTFRRNGEAVVTPVGCVAEAGVLYMLTPPDTGKVKRVRHNGRAVVAPCGMRGTVPAGSPSAEGVARVLGDAETDRVRYLMMRRIFVYRLVRMADGVLRRKRPLVAPAVTPS
jgi:PPOX class probable F420-dependent enzyme